MTPLSQHIKNETTKVLVGLYDKVDGSKFCVGPSNDSNLLLMPNWNAIKMKALIERRLLGSSVIGKVDRRQHGSYHK